MIELPVTLKVTFDEESAIVSIVGIIGEHEFQLEFVKLRPEHNNLIDAIKIITSGELRDKLNYDLEFTS